MATALTILGIILAVPLALLAFAELRYLIGRKAVDRDWQDQRPERLRNVGTTRSLAILPLIDWFPSRPGLRGEAGVSYLIKTDQSTILMDLGLNLAGSDPSALQHNMRELGVTVGDVDTIVISHGHADHVGGLRWLMRKTFSPGNVQPDLGGKRVFAPLPLSYPGLAPECSSKPTLIARGVATIGAIPGMIFIGRIDEQSLAVNVEGKGIVLVVGCGHQSLPRILARATQLFSEPIYGIIGGLHYPLPRGRLTKLGIDLQNFLVYGLFHKPGRKAVQGDIALLAQRKPQWVSLSAHDSSDEMIEEFRRVFKERYHDLRVGEWQRVAGTAPMPEDGKSHALSREVAARALAPTG